MLKLQIPILFMLLSLCGYAQKDTLQPVKTVKEAPADLFELLGKITEQETRKSSSDVELEIDGLLIDETKTKSGKDFYDYFYNGWEAPPNAKNYSIFITEKPYRLTTTMLEIHINETLVFQSFLQPRGEYIEMLAEQAVAQTQVYLQNYEEILRQLEGEDQSGTGIY